MIKCLLDVAGRGTVRRGRHGAPATAGGRARGPFRIQGVDAASNTHRYAVLGDRTPAPQMTQWRTRARIASDMVEHNINMRSIPKAGFPADSSGPETPTETQESRLRQLQRKIMAIQQALGTDTHQQVKELVDLMNTVPLGGRVADTLEKHNWAAHRRFVERGPAPSRDA